jgi:hypothetical protein
MRGTTSRQLKCAALVKRFKHIKTEDKITRRKAGDFFDKLLFVVKTYIGILSKPL